MACILHSWNKLGGANMIATEEITITEEQILEFQKYYESCHNCKLDHLRSKDVLLLLDAIRSKQFLKFLYCHL